jgi:hypothetical protein
MKPYEFLVRWNSEGVLQGAHVIFQEQLTDSLGNTTPVIHPAQPVAIGEAQGFPLEDVLGEVNAAALKTIDELKQSHQDETEANTAAHNAAIQQLQDAHQTELLVLKQEHEASLSQLRQSYEQQLEQLTQELESFKNPPIKWSQFRLAMMGNAAYDRVEESLSDSKEGTRLLIKLTTVVSMDNPNLVVLQSVWNTALDLVGYPTADDIAEWNANATGTNVPIRFDDNGKITII